MAIRSTVTDVSEDDILVANTSSIWDESQRIAKVVFNCNYYPEYDYLKKIEVRFNADAQMYGELRENVEHSSKINLGRRFGGL